MRVGKKQVMLHQKKSRVTSIEHGVWCSRIPCWGCAAPPQNACLQHDVVVFFQAGCDSFCHKIHVNRSLCGLNRKV